MLDESSISNKGSVIRALIDKHEHRIRRFIGRRSGPEVLKRTTVDDIFQETVVTALSSANNFAFQDDDRFVGWISTIARRVISRLASLRKNEPNIVRIKRAESTGIGVPEFQLFSSSRTPSSVESGHERQYALGVALEKLPEHYCMVLKLYQLQGHSLSEVSAEMGRTKGATARLIARATEALRKKMT